jgi:hypothetical protein
MPSRMAVQHVVAEEQQREGREAEEVVHYDMEERREEYAVRGTRGTHHDTALFPVPMNHRLPRRKLTLPLAAISASSTLMRLYWGAFDAGALADA